MFDVKKHCGCPVCWRGQKKGHQVILLVHDSRLVDGDGVVIWSCDSNDLRGMTEAPVNQNAMRCTSWLLSRMHVPGSEAAAPQNVPLG